MPEYSFNCTECDTAFSEVWSISEYDYEISKVICPECQSNDVFRDFSEDKVVSNYVKGLHEASTLGEYADKQAKKLGKSKVEQMRRDQKTKKKETLESKLPSGMSKTSYQNTAKISKSEMLKRRSGK